MEDRLVRDVDAAQSAGDKLAIAVLACLQSGVACEEDIQAAVLEYCIAQGWNGPACRWVGQVIDYENDVKITREW